MLYREDYDPTVAGNENDLTRVTPPDERDVEAILQRLLKQPKDPVTEEKIKKNK